MKTSVMSPGLNVFLDYLFSKRRVDKKTHLYKLVPQVPIPACVPLFFRSSVTERSYYVGFVLRLDRICKMYVYNNIPADAMRELPPNKSQIPPDMEKRVLAPRIKAPSMILSNKRNDVAPKISSVFVQQPPPADD